MARRSSAQIPPDLRPRLETARLDLLALFRALDRMDLTPAEIPQRLLRQLFELDADYVEALWALDQPSGSLDMHAMLRDTLAALEQLPQACSRFRTICRHRLFPPSVRWRRHFANDSTRQKPTIWYPVVIPKTVKHPSCR